ncbi:MAG TPA: EAL domain-containing response regulator [Usitatibacter sp.]|nr:EAL domain-containing response regulator [Usitatibacter sp.]
MMDISALRFLVVEDHSFQRWALGNMLEGLGARYVFAAADGQAALDFMRGSDDPVDIVVSDLDMPGMDGMEFIRHLVSECRDASLIIVSSMERTLIASVEGMARAYGANLLGAVEKPATARKLAAVIRLHGGRSRAEAAVPLRTFPAGEVLAGIRKGEIEAFFQPKVEMETRSLRGAEALSRWRHPRHGLVHPKAFIPSLEAAGLMHELSEAVVASAARGCRAWTEEGLNASVSVNLSLTSLGDLTLADRMTAIVESCGLDPRRMIFEITESAAAADVGKALENLSRLRMKGFGLSIDDYGTGYSSMERLARVPFTELKIDRSFVKQAAMPSSNRAALESSLEMAEKMRIPAVAEGVESLEEWQMLRSLGCPLAQGYYVAPAMALPDFIAWARGAAG